MNEKTGIVFHGWLELSAEEQAELIKAIQDYNRGTSSSRSVTFKESTDFVHKRISLGPIAGGCPCCGR